VKVIDARYDGDWQLPAVGVVSAPIAVLIRPDGYVAVPGAHSLRESGDHVHNVHELAFNIRLY